MQEGSGTASHSIPAARRRMLPLPSSPASGGSKSVLGRSNLFMNHNHGATGEKDSLLENFAAELTAAVYPIALRHGMAGSWIKVELDLWKALAETVKTRARDRPPGGSSEEFKVWQEGLLVALTESAFYVTMTHGFK